MLQLCSINSIGTDTEKKNDLIKPVAKSKVTEEAAKPAKIQIVALVDKDCNDCFGIQSVVDSVKNNNADVTKEDVINVLKHISRILKKEGVFFISVRKGSDEILILHEKLGKNEVMVGFYEINELEALLREAGFEIMNTYIQDGNDFTWINVFAKKI